MDVVATSQPGVFVCGAAQGPKDIPDSVQQGSSAAACATSLLAEARGSLIEPPPQYEERDIRGEKPRIGVFVCHCGINIAGVVDTEAVAEYAKSLPGVEYAIKPDVRLFDRPAKRDQAGNRGIQAQPVCRCIVHAAHP